MERSGAVFPLVGEPLAVDLANTLVTGKGVTVDLLATDDQARAWWELHERELHAAAPGDPPVMEPLRELRGAVVALLEAARSSATPPAVAIDLLNAASAGGALYPRLTLEDGALVLAPTASGSPLATGLAAIARSAMEIAASDDADRLTVCDGPHCGLLFVATNPRRRWCSPNRCGNRVRAARYYRRRVELAS